MLFQSCKIFIQHSYPLVDPLGDVFIFGFSKIELEENHKRIEVTMIIGRQLLIGTKIDIEFLFLFWIDLFLT